LALFVEGDGPAENDQLMMDYSGQEMTLYEVCALNNMLRWAYCRTATSNITNAQTMGR